MDLIKNVLPKGQKFERLMVGTVVPAVTPLQTCLWARAHLCKDLRSEKFCWLLNGLSR